MFLFLDAIALFVLLHSEHASPPVVEQTELSVQLGAFEPMNEVQR